jgi:hypothetical protein
VSLLLVDAAAAYYSPNLGRWIKRDPIEETGGANLYGFACNQSINLFDPNGKIVIGIGGLIPFSGRSYLTKMGEGIAVQASRYIDSHFTSWRKSIEIGDSLMAREMCVI